jgi:hypothetical protein
MRRRSLSNRIVSVVVSMLAAAVWAGIPQAAHAFTPIANGDLIVSLGNLGKVQEYTPSGSLVQTLMNIPVSIPTGSAFDGQGNLYVSEFGANAIERIDAVTGAATVFSDNTILADGSSYNSPESVAFNSGFTKMYVSDANRFGRDGGIHVVDASTGKGLDFLPISSSSGSDGRGESDWLAFNAANTLYMTNENPVQGIMQVNEATKDIVSPSLVANLPNVGYAISFDKLGDVWVGDTNTILEYSPAGLLLQTITNTNFSTVFAAVFNPAGDTFYAGDIGHGNVYTYDLNGTLLGTFNAGNAVTGLSVAGASLPNQPPSVTTSLSGGGQSGPAITVPSGTVVTDSATLTGANAASAGGTVTYTVYAEPTCTINGVSAGTKTVVGGVVPNSDPLTLNGPSGTVWYWQAVYSGDPTTGNSPSMSVCGSETVTLLNPEEPITATGTNVSATEGALFTGTVATFTDPTTTATAAEYTASISWGDGHTSTGIVSGPPGGPFMVTGSNTYAEEGPYTVMVTITDIDNAANGAITTSTATVSDAALLASCAVVATSSQSFSGLTATFTDAASPFGTLSDFTAMIDWGDGTTSAGAVTGPDGGPYSVSGTHTYTSTGPFTITTTINDVGGSTASTPGCSRLVFAFAPGGGAFVIGDNNSANRTSVTFWGAKWWKLNSLTGGSAPASFKGFAEAPTTPACSTGWSTDTGNSTPPPAGPLPAFMGVIVTSSATQSGSIDSGNTVHIVVVQTKPGYQPNPGHPGTGTVVAQVC